MEAPTESALTLTAANPKSEDVGEEDGNDETAQQTRLRPTSPVPSPAPEPTDSVSTPPQFHCDCGGFRACGSECTTVVVSPQCDVDVAFANDFLFYKYGVDAGLSCTADACGGGHGLPNETNCVKAPAQARARR